MKRLTLQIDRPCFKAILQGKQKVEHRYIYPSNAGKYVTQKEKKDENGEEYVEVNCVPYDALYLINGRRKDAPRLTVAVDHAEFIIMSDENGNDLTFEENGEEYLVCQVWYYLGAILDTENVPEDYYTEVLPDMDEHGEPLDGGNKED